MPEVRRHTARGRRPWYTLEVAGRYHHLGTDQGAAYARAAELLAAAGTPEPEVQHVAGLVSRYTDLWPESYYHLRPWSARQAGLELSTKDNLI